MAIQYESQGFTFVFRDLCVDISPAQLADCTMVISLASNTQSVFCQFPNNSSSTGANKISRLCDVYNVNS